MGVAGRVAACDLTLAPGMAKPNVVAKMPHCQLIGVIALLHESRDPRAHELVDAKLQPS